MGAQQTKCPPGFQNDMLLTCSKECPPDFKFVKEAGMAGKCVYKADNRFTVQTVQLPLPPPDTLPKQYTDEIERFEEELAKVRQDIQRESQTFETAKSDQSKYVQQFEKIQSDLATFRSAEVIRNVSDSLKPMRPPTAPDSDIERERMAILAVVRKNMLLIQISLFIIFLALLTYLIVPSQYAHNIVFLLLSVNIAIGFFLWK